MPGLLLCWLRDVFSTSFKGKAEVGTVPSMEKVYHALIAGTVDPDEKGVRFRRMAPLYTDTHELQQIALRSCSTHGRLGQLGFGDLLTSWPEGSHVVTEYLGAGVRASTARDGFVPSLQIVV